MAFNSNPLGLNGPNATPNAQQSDYRTPTLNANAPAYPLGWNVLSMSWPVPAYIQPNFVTSAPTPTVFYPSVLY